jgi:hypothetical protein
MSDVRVAQLSRGALVALVFQNLSRHRPDLDAGIYACAKAGFGNYLGFVAALGYWIVCCLADLACLLLIKGTLGRENAQGAPHRALLMTDLAVHAFLIVTWFAESAFTIALKMTRAMTLLPCLMVAGLRGGHALVGWRQVPAAGRAPVRPGDAAFHLRSSRAAQAGLRPGRSDPVRRIQQCGARCAGRARDRHADAMLI